METGPWLATLTDVPRHVEARAALLDGRGRVLGEDPRDSFVFDERGGLAWSCGRPGAESVAALLALDESLLEVGVGIEDGERVGALLAGWRGHPVTLHLHPDPTSLPLPERTVRMLDGRHLEELAALPAPLAAELATVLPHAAVAATSVAGELVSFCAAYSVTESLWDVSIDTVEGHRRQGHARAAFTALARRLLDAGRQPVWGSLDTNAASMGLARALGFVPVDRMLLFTRQETDE